MNANQIKSGLQGLAMVSALILGSYSLYHFNEAIQLRSEAQQWRQVNGAWYATHCESEVPGETISRLICQEAWSRKAYHDAAPGRALTEAVTALALAISPTLALLLWSLRSRWRPR